MFRCLSVEVSLTFSVNDIFASQKGSWPTLAKTDFGQTDFGQNRLWPKPTLAKTDFGQTDFGQTDFGQTDFDLACVVLCVVCVAWVLFHCVKVGLHVWVLVSRFGLDRPSWDSPSLDRPSPTPVPHVACGSCVNLLQKLVTPWKFPRVHSSFWHTA